MRCTCDPMLILGYGYWTGDDDKPMTNKAGEPIEWVQLLDQEQDEVLKMTMRGVNGERPKEFTPARPVLSFAVDRKASVVKGRDGGDYEVIRERLKPTCTGFAPGGKVEQPVKG